MLHFSKIFKVKDGQEATFMEWMRVLAQDRSQEAIETFAHEGVTREVFALFRSKDGSSYVVAFNEADEEPKPSDPEVHINQEHRAIKEQCLEAISDPGEVLLDLRV